MTSASGLTATSATPGFNSATCCQSEATEPTSVRYPPGPCNPTKAVSPSALRAPALPARWRSVTGVEHAVGQFEDSTADRTSEVTGAHGAPLHPVRQEHEKALVVVGGTAQVVGELDEHEGSQESGVGSRESEI